MHASLKQLTVREDELCHARPAQRLSDSRLDRVKQRFHKTVCAINNGPAVRSRRSSPSTSLTNSQRGERYRHRTHPQGVAEAPLIHQPKQRAMVKIEAWRLVCARGSAETSPSSMGPQDRRQSTTVGLIYSSPDEPVRQKSDDTRGPDPNPSPNAEDMDDTETAALIGDCYAFGKVACCLPKRASHSPTDQPLNADQEFCGTISH